MLALKVSLALIVFGGTASALVLHLILASAHKAPPSGAVRGRTGPGRVQHGAACVRLP